MGKHWDDFKDRLGRKSVGAGMIFIDLGFLVLLAVLMISADLARVWIFKHLGEGNLFTRVTLVIIEIVLDLSAIAVVAAWLWEDIKRIWE